MFHFMFVHYTLSSVWVAEWPPFGCYEMDKTSISMFEILEPRGSSLGKYSI